jgi:Fur family ferric uptake transcriptional regulator
VSLGTIYRNLEILSESGMIGKIELGGMRKKFDGNSEHHYHVRCVKCSAVSDVPMEPSYRLQKRVGEMSGYKILGHRLEFIGICPACSHESRVGATRTTGSQKAAGQDRR